MPVNPEDTDPPTVPTGLTASPASPTSIQLNWNASTDNVAVAGYKILREGVQIATAAGTSYLDATVANGTTACYTVRAFDTPGNTSDDSSPSLRRDARSLRTLGPQSHGDGCELLTTSPCPGAFRPTTWV